MATFCKVMFIFWLLLLPISWVISSYISIIAPDKMLAPLLLIFGVLSVLRASSQRVRRVLALGALAFLLLLVRNFTFIISGSDYWLIIWDDMVKMGYFMVPVLCIRNVYQFYKVGWIVTLIAISGCISAFLVSIDMLALPLQRFEESRIGVESLRKAIGLFPSYGDLAQYIAFSVLWVIVVPREVTKINTRAQLMRYLVGISVILGLLGTQSRNILLSLIIALVVLWMLTRMEHAGARVRTGLVLGLSGIFIVFVGIVGIFSTDIINALSSLGGSYAKHTAMARLEQYALAWKIISESPLFGADVVTYQKLGVFIEGIHNMWLRLAAHGGLLSVLVMVLLLVRIYSGVRNASRVYAKSAYAKVVTGYLAALIVSVEFYVGMGEMFWALLGIAASLSCIPPFRSSSTNVVESSPSDGRQKFGARILMSQK